MKRFFPILYFLTRNFFFTDMQLLKNRGFIEEKTSKNSRISLYTLFI